MNHKELKVKQFTFPTFEKWWYKNFHGPYSAAPYKCTIGDFTLEISHDTVWLWFYIDGIDSSFKGKKKYGHNCFLCPLSYNDEHNEEKKAKLKEYYDARAAEINDEFRDYILSYLKD